MLSSRFPIRLDFPINSQYGNDVDLSGVNVTGNPGGGNPPTANQTTSGNVWDDVSKVVGPGGVGGLINSFANLFGKGTGSGDTMPTPPGSGNGGNSGDGSTSGWSTTKILVVIASVLGGITLLIVGIRLFTKKKKPA